MATSPNVSSLDEDDRLEVSSADGSAAASLWWSHVPSLPNERLGVIGRFDASSADAAADVLQRARLRLLAAGCTLAVGPMDGSTWRRYRFVSAPGSEPPFFLEPTNPAAWPQWWREAGFTSLAEYTSTASDDLTTRDARIEGVAARMRETGVTIRPLRTTDFESELGRIYDVSVVSFRSNYLYSPLPRETFIHQYRALQAHVRPELVLLAEHDGRPVGYVFAIPDLAQAQRGESVTTFVVKTLAVLPGRTYAGLGALLLAAAHDNAGAAGFRRVIHALMHESNTSGNLSAHYARPIRRYTLFQSRLASAVVA